MNKNCAFVFAVCGSDEHIETLNFSLIPLLKRTNFPVIVVTELSRNSSKINHTNIVDVKTPVHFDNHQASIYLKTSLHKILPVGPLYCYLDSDVLAIGNYVDNIFDEYIEPIRFALDHCTMNYFSAFAMNCNCINEFDFHQKNILENTDEFIYSRDEQVIQNREILNNYFNKINGNIFLKTMYFFKYILSGKRVKFANNFSYDKKNAVYLDNNGKPFMRSFRRKETAIKLGYKWSDYHNDALTKLGVPVSKAQCNHLLNSLNTKFDINIMNEEFHHYNGGVFLFNEHSHNFLNYWHNSTLEIFTDKNFKTRDQGTLIATTWKFNHQNSKPLGQRWNHIIDYHLDIDIDSIIKEHVANQIDKAPQFLHVYHHFRDYNWPVWNSIEALL